MIGSVGERVPEVFRAAEQRVVAVVEKVRQEPEAAVDLARLSAAAQGDFLADVAGMAGTGEARRLALQALAAGLLCGALDGAILLVAGQEPPAAPKPPVGPATLADDLGKLDRALQQGREIARDNWAKLSADELQLLSGYGKQQNLGTAEEAEALAAQSDLPGYQTFLLATFKAGYALGLVDATLVATTGERPGQPKEV